MVDYGTDLDDSFELDNNGDFKTISGVDNAIQHIKNDLLTKYWELTELGHLDYGNKAYWWLNATNLKTAMAHIRIYTREVLAKSPYVYDLVEDVKTKYNSVDEAVEVKINVILAGDETAEISVDIFTKDRW